MTTLLEQKSSVDEIMQRFDNNVERFSNIETGQTATIDAPMAMELITQAAFNSTKMNLLRKFGFNHVELLHKNSCFAAFGAIKTG